MQYSNYYLVETQNTISINVIIFKNTLSDFLEFLFEYSVYLFATYGQRNKIPHERINRIIQSEFIFIKAKKVNAFFLTSIVIWVMGYKLTQQQRSSNIKEKLCYLFSLNK